MIVTLDERLSDSPYLQTISHGYTTSAGSTIRPSEYCWHMVLVRHAGHAQLYVVGPLTSSGIATWGEGAEVIWIKFKLGTFMPPVPVRNILDEEKVLPEASSKSFWLNGSAWQFPDYENVDTFVEWLVRDGALAVDPVVNAVLQDQAHDLASRTVRHRFLRATGLTQNQIYQMTRAEQAASLLRQGVSILDTVEETGYFDQPHLTRALKQWIGRTPAELLRLSTPSCHLVQDSNPAPSYNPTVLTAIRG